MLVYSDVAHEFTPIADESNRSSARLTGDTSRSQSTRMLPRMLTRHWSLPTDFRA